MTELLKNHLGGRWVTGSGAGTTLFDPVLGDALVRVDATGLDLRAGFAFAREQGGAALRAMRYRERGAMLAAVVKVLQAHRDAGDTLVGRTVAEVEQALILQTLGHCHGNRTHAATILGISIRTLRNKLKQYSDDGALVPAPAAERAAG